VFQETQCEMSTARPTHTTQLSNTIIANRAIKLYIIICFTPSSCIANRSAGVKHNNSNYNTSNNNNGSLSKIALRNNKRGQRGCDDYTYIYIAIDLHAAEAESIDGAIKRQSVRSFSPAAVGSPTISVNVHPWCISDDGEGVCRRRHVFMLVLLYRRRTI